MLLELLQRQHHPLLRRNLLLTDEHTLSDEIGQLHIMLVIPHPLAYEDGRVDSIDAQHYVDILSQSAVSADLRAKAELDDWVKLALVVSPVEWWWLLSINFDVVIQVQEFKWNDFNLLLIEHQLLLFVLQLQMNILEIVVFVNLLPLISAKLWLWFIDVFYLKV